ncbi:unnamed protein product [Chrysoparadoxa australica]
MPEVGEEGETNQPAAELTQGENVDIDVEEADEVIEQATQPALTPNASQPPPAPSQPQATALSQQDLHVRAAVGAKCGPEELLRLGVDSSMQPEDIWKKLAAGGWTIEGGRYVKPGVSRPLDDGGEGLDWLPSLDATASWVCETLHGEEDILTHHYMGEPGLTQIDGEEAPNLFSSGTPRTPAPVVTEQEAALSVTQLQDRLRTVYGWGWCEKNGATVYLRPGLKQDYDEAINKSRSGGNALLDKLEDGYHYFSDQNVLPRWLECNHANAGFKLHYTDCTAKRLPKSPEKPNRKRKRSVSGDDAAGSEAARRAMDRETPKTPLGRLAQAEQRLSALYLPETFCGRDAQVKEVLDFLTQHLSAGRGGSLYLSGTPGTGKTQTMEVVKGKLKELAGASTWPSSPSFYSVGGNSFVEKEGIFSSILEEVTGEVGLTAREAKGILEGILKPPTPTSGKMVILTLDEVDDLWNKDKESAQELFKWAADGSSRFILVGTSNKMDVNSARHSQHKPQVVIFPTYKSDELVAILSERAGDVIHQRALGYCCKKVASDNGDVRQAMGICANAVREVFADLDKDEDEEVKEGEAPEEPGTAALVQLDHMKKAVTRAQKKPKDKIGHLTEWAKVVLCVAVAQAGASGTARQVTFGQLSDEVAAYYDGLTVTKVPPQGVNVLLNNICDIGVMSGTQEDAPSRDTVFKVNLDRGQLRDAVGDSACYKHFFP